MKFNSLVVAVACLTMAAPLARAESPLAGTWKFNKEKSTLTGDTITFAAATSGSVRVTSGGMTYTFKPDGSDSATPFGNTSAWTKVNDTTWQEVVKLSGKTLVTNTYKLADDGTTMKVSYQGTKPNGDPINDSAAYSRMTGAKGFPGKWKSVKVDAGMSGYVIKDNGDGSLTWALPDMKASVQIRPDGKDAAASGPTVPPGFTLALTKTGPRTFVLVEKISGKRFARATETISADGRTWTEHGSAAGVSEPYTSVFEKQQ